MTKWNAVYYKHYTDSEGNAKSFAYKIGSAFPHTSDNGDKRMDVVLDVLPPAGSTITLFPPKPKEG